MAQFARIIENPVSKKKPLSSPKRSSRPEAPGVLAPEDELTVELASQLLSGRPERIIDVALSQLPQADHAKKELTRVTDTLAALALAARSSGPTPKLAARIQKTLAARAHQPKRALLVIDMLNDHLTPGRPLEVPRARAVVPALKKRIEEARKAKMPVVFVCDRHEPDDSDLESWAVHNVRGTEGAEIWPELAPKSGDAIVPKPTYSAFTRSDLEATLRKLGVDTLVLTGCATELGMLATATDALQRGYAVEIPPDTQAGMAEATERVAMMLVQIMPPYGPARAELLKRRKKN